MTPPACFAGVEVVAVVAGVETVVAAVGTAAFDSDPSHVEPIR